MAFGVNKSKYYVDNNEFARNTFFIASILVGIIFTIVLLFKGCSYLGYIAEAPDWEKQLYVYCTINGYSYDKAKYLSEYDGSTEFRGMIFKVTNFRDTTGLYEGDHKLTLYGDGGYGYKATTWHSDHHKIE